MLSILFHTCTFEDMNVMFSNLLVEKLNKKADARSSLVPLEVTSVRISRPSETSWKYSENLSYLLIKEFTTYLRI